MHKCTKYGDLRLYSSTPHSPGTKARFQCGSLLRQSWAYTGRSGGGVMWARGSAAILTVLRTSVPSRLGGGRYCPAGGRRCGRLINTHHFRTPVFAFLSLHCICMNTASLTRTGLRHTTSASTWHTQCMHSMHTLASQRIATRAPATVSAICAWQEIHGFGFSSFMVSDDLV